MITSNPAKTDYPVHSLIANRWSTLAFSPEPVEEDKIHSLLEAARWAPSSYNEQPWQYIVGYKGDETHKKIGDSLMEGNAWAKEAPVLILSVASLHFSQNAKLNRHALYDTGSADVLMHLQATELGLSMHQMAGFDIDAVRADFGIGEIYEPAAVMVLGYPGDSVKLEGQLKEREETPRSRKSHKDLMWPTT